MTQGFLLFAHDNEQVHYSLLAVWQARRIRHWLNKPTSIVTDQPSLDNLAVYGINPYSEFDHVILSGADTEQKKSYSGNTLTFKNVDRCLAWELTPYDETLVIDTDIAIQSDRLNTVWGSQEDYLICSNSKDVFGRQFPTFNYVNDYGGIKFQWATLFYFKKNQGSKLFFDLCQYIKTNYKEYVKEYGLKDRYLRNDHVWSIAVHQLGGVSIPVNLWFITDADQVITMTDDSVVVATTDYVAKIQGQDIHLMNKFNLIRHVKKEMGYD
jgi:hypothetical protein